MRRYVELFFLTALVVAAAGCEVSTRSAEPKPPATEGGSYQRLIWPQPPAPTRIRYMRSIAEPRDLGIKKSFFGRLIDVITGNHIGRLVRPTGVAERDGVIYVADSGAQAVWIFDPANQTSVKVGKIDDTDLM